MSQHEEPPELKKLVEELKARKARMAEQAAAAEAEREQQRIDDEKETADFKSELEAVIKSFAGNAQIVSPAEYRRRCLPDVLARLRGWSYPDRYIREIGDWQCEPQEIVFEMCVQLFQRVGAIVALVGERGTGKTTIAAQLAVRLAWDDWDRVHNHESGKPFSYQEAPYRKLSDLIARFKPLYADFGGINTDELIQRRNNLCRGADLLTIDELHDCDDLKMKNRVLTDIIDRRYSACTDTLLISNQSQERFRATTDDSVLSRISEHGVIIPCEWPSWRERLATQRTEWNA